MKKILISVNPWQTRVAILWDDRLQNIYFASPLAEGLERSYFKGIITKVLPGIQTAFVDIGQERAGFLHISEVDRELALQRMSSSLDLEEEGQEGFSRNIRPTMDISKIFKEGEAVLVQVSKEPVYEKGAKLTTCFTLPGRFIVLMPNIPRIAISKKIENREERARLRELLRSHLPEGMGAIIRTTSEGRKDKEIVQDVNFLVNNWKIIQKSFVSAEPRELIYQDLTLALRSVRDYLDDDVEKIITDNKESQNEIYKFVKTIAPEHAHKIGYYEGSQDLFERFNVEKQLEEALAQKVHLRSGGSIIVETAQAMTVIDVNTGRYIGRADLEETILQTNLEAAEEIVRQLRLRNIGGLIVIDFIDMAHPSNRQRLFKYFDKTLKERDKFQSVVLRLSEFGLVQMTRKRVGKTLLQELGVPCPTCHSLGSIKSIRTLCYELLPKIKQELKAHRAHDSISVYLSPEIFEFITEHEYDSILKLEKKYRCKLTLVSDETLNIDQYRISV